MNIEELLAKQRLERIERVKAELTELRYEMPDTPEGNKFAGELEEAGYLIEEILEHFTN